MKKNDWIEDYLKMGTEERFDFLLNRYAKNLTIEIKLKLKNEVDEGGRILIMYESISKFDKKLFENPSSITYPDAYIKTITKNMAEDERLRITKLKVIRLGEIEGKALQNQKADSKDYGKIDLIRLLKRDILPSLGEICQRIINERMFWEKRWKVIAKNERKTEDAIRQQYQRCLKEIRKQIREQGLMDDFKSIN